MDPVVGPCKAAFKKFYYDKATKECKVFTYGGCRGNKNRFNSLEECNNFCKSEEKSGKGSQDYAAPDSDTKGKFLQKQAMVKLQEIAVFNGIYRQSPVKSPDIKNIIVVTLT